MSSDDFYSLFGSPQEESKAPQQAAPVQQAAPAQAQVAVESDGEFGEMFAGQAAGPSFGPGLEMGLEPGSAPHAAVEESPLSIIDRARLGWVRTKANQRKVLDSTFGEGNVDEAPMGDGETGFVVRKGDKWFQVDPHFSWKAGDVKDAAGDMAEDIGEYGLRAAAAAAAFGKGAAAGAAMGAPLGPYGAAAGAAIGGMGMAGMAAASAEGVDMSARSLFNKGDIGGDIVKSQEDLDAQLRASFMFGMEQELASGGIKLGAKAGAWALKGAVQAVSDTPLGRTAAAKMLSVMTGLKENLSRIRVEDPAGTAKYDLIAADDVLNNTNKLKETMKARVVSFAEGAQQRLRGIGRQYDDVATEAASVKFNPLAPTQKGEAPVVSFLGELENAGFTRKGKLVDPSRSHEVERQLGASERKVLGYLTQQSRVIAEKVSKDGGISYADMRKLMGSLDRSLGAREEIADPHLRALVAKFRRNLKDSLHAQLHDAAPETSRKLLSLDSKYGPAKDLVEELASKSDDAYVDTFLKKVIKDDGDFDSELMSSVGELLGKADPTADILKMHVASKSTNLLTGGAGGGIGKFIPRTPLGASRAFSAASATKQNIKQVGTGLGAQASKHIPYLNEAVRMTRTMDAKTRKAFLANPEAVDLVFQMVGAGAAAEDAEKEELLRQSGVLE